ncbi:ABC transporter ATP-binding protein [Pedobacter sandarakinus]|uniref:ABC transporter ATP-binding protein n=1 Tax=Pedobacter sandarakinus TaxID=353156 RepID=UPI0022477D19|nr:ABC transporter ATP-binding protein [Pedobacter sandarakinus]MCX2574906.1 ABC transporter ATP-binding protein [Pedobacter sandarakinus]
MIRLENVSKSFGQVRGVRSVSFEVKAGENLILLGTSGCGKTTTLKMINRLIEPSEGRMFFNEVDIIKEDPEALRRKMGFVMQNIGLFPHYTIYENVAVVPKLLGWDKPKIDSRVQDLLAKLHLPTDCLQKFPHQLSGGQKQRVGLARALIANPPVLLMDEPFGALDNVTRTKIRKEFKDLDELKTKTIVMVTHDIQEAFEMGDRICLMDKGEVVQIGTPKELLYHPINEFARNFFNGDRLTLGFRLTTLDDLASQFANDGNVEATLLGADLSVWDALSTFQPGNERLGFKTSDGALKTFTYQTLTQAFNHYQMQHHE